MQYKFFKSKANLHWLADMDGNSKLKLRLTFRIQVSYKVSKCFIRNLLTGGHVMEDMKHISTHVV